MQKLLIDKKTRNLIYTKPKFQVLFNIRTLDSTFLNDKYKISYNLKTNESSGYAKKVLNNLDLAFKFSRKHKSLDAKMLMEEFSGLGAKIEKNEGTVGFAGYIFENDEEEMLYKKNYFRKK